jgi:hypothetical protein
MRGILHILLCTQIVALPSKDNGPKRRNWRNAKLVVRGNMELLASVLPT